MKPHYDVAEGPTWHSPRSGLVQPERCNEWRPCDVGWRFGSRWRAAIGELNRSALSSVVPFAVKCG